MAVEVSVRGLSLLMVVTASCALTEGGTGKAPRDAPEARGADEDALEPADRAHARGAIAGQPSVGLAARGAAAEVESASGTPLGLAAFSANGRVQPHGRPTHVYFEYGPTADYGATTPSRPLPPKLTAHYEETFDKGRGGLSGGITGEDLRYRAGGGVEGGYVRYVEPGPAGDDPNHIDGIGWIHLTQYLYPGSYVPEDGSPMARWGGGAPDLRDASVELAVRGVRFRPRGTDLVLWLQHDVDLSMQNDTYWRRANWAFTGGPLTAHLASGEWERVSFRLANDTRRWSYGGKSYAQHRPNYVYTTLDNALGSANTDVFYNLVYVDPYNEPQGRIDYDEMRVTYRNHNVLASSNGGLLVSQPEASEGAELLTDGWRHGDGREWATPWWPSGPQELVYALTRPVDVRVVQVHQSDAYPSAKIEVLLSEDGETWTPALEGRMPRRVRAGGNFNFLLADHVGARARWVKVRVLSGHQPERWGLGEIEVFGEGAVMETDDDWYNVNADIPAAPGETVHYRLVAESDGRVFYGADATYDVPTDAHPLVETGAAREITGGHARLEARLAPMGRRTQFMFEWGVDETYGHTSEHLYGGREITPRHVVQTVEHLEPGREYHYRVVAWNGVGRVEGEDRTFVAQ